MPDTTVTKAYCSLTGAKGDPSGRQKFYQIHFSEQPSPVMHSWNGPYRDKTDAENAAHDEAKSRNLELEWLD